MLKRVLIAGALGVLLLVGGAALFVALNRGDAPAVDDADLRVVPPVVRPEDNAYPVLQEAVAHMVWDQSHWKRLQALARGQEWDESLARSTVRRNREALRLLREALRRPAFQAPPSGSLDDEIALLCTELARASGIRAQLEARAGAGERAFSEAVAPIQLGKLVLSDRGGNLTEHAAAMCMKTIGVTAVSASLRSLAPTPEQSLRWTAELASLRTDPAAWRAAWAGEYQFIKAVVEKAESPADRRAVAERNAASIHALWIPRLLTPEYAYQPKATLNLIADWIRRMRAHAGASCARLPRPARLTWVSVLQPNGIGRVMLAIAAPVDIETVRCRSDSRLAATEVLLALRAYQVAHGALPDSLDALVPEEIAAVPVSAMDGRPIRYSRSERKLCIDHACDENAIAIPF